MPDRETFDLYLAEAGQRARSEPVADRLFLPDASGAGGLDADALGSASWDEVDQQLADHAFAIGSLGARTRAVAYTRPLHELESNKVRLGGQAWAGLNLIELGFHAIDVVALRMDFDAGARHDDVIAAVASLARLQDPTLEDDLRVGEKVLDGLITGRSTNDAEAHQSTYGTWDKDGYVAKRFDYALVTEHLDAEGELYLRATDAAITVLIGALELDVESAQIAAELRLNELVRRGLLTAAIEEAKRAGYRSIQYQEQLRRQLADARLNTTEPGAMAAVDRLVDHALEHVIDRYKAERSIMANVSSTRDEAADDRVRRRANQLIEQLEDCERRHQRLQRHLQRARGDFREIHAGQLATPPAPPSVVDIERQLLRPLLEAPIGAGDRVASLLTRSMSSPGRMAVPDLDELATGLCEVPIEGHLLGDVVDDDLGDLVDQPSRPPFFPDETWQLTDRILEEVETPVRLSKLVSEAEDSDRRGPAAHLLVLLVANAFDPGLSERLRDDAGDDAATLVVAADGTGFESHTVFGDDPWVARAWATHPAGLPADPWDDHAE